MALTLLLPQMSGLHRRPQPLELSVIIREQDSSSGPTPVWDGAGGRELGAELRFLTLATANDGREQWELLQREIEQGADALVVAPADPAALEKSLGELDRDVPVVTLESPLEGADLSVVVPNAEMGASLAQAALEDWKGGTVLLLDTAPHCTAVDQRLAAAKDLLAGAGVEAQVETVSVDSLASRLPELLRQLSPAQMMTFEPGGHGSGRQCEKPGGAFGGSLRRRRNRRRCSGPGSGRPVRRGRLERLRRGLSGGGRSRQTGQGGAERNEAAALFPDPRGGHL